MSVSIFEPMNAPSLPVVHPATVARPQVGIERLPTRRLNNEPRESMNCKSCRKRKIKCNRLRPACEACQVFQCPCIYDAVPKKRGPKTDVLEALLKRVDGLEAKLKEKNSEATSPTTPTAPIAPGEASSSTADVVPAANPDPQPKRIATDVNRQAELEKPSRYSASPLGEPASPDVQPEALLDTYFTRFHAKPFHIVDESFVRQRLQLNQLPGYLIYAIYAVAARYTPHPGGYLAAVQLSETYATRARSEINTDEPSVDSLQALLLLAIAFTGAGKGKKAYMLTTNAVGMAMALEIHREMDVHARVTPVEREVRRRLFWTCYVLDRFTACGSKRPSLIGDGTILLRLPCWSPNPASLPIEGEFFQSGPNLQYLQGSGKKSQGSTGMLIDICRILGITNRYLAAGGVKGDSHFPWHSLSNLSKIRQDLDIWASGTEDVFSSLDTLFGQADSTVLVLSKLIYHLIHCLIYRPFLPIDLAELSGTGQHQSWQIDATNMCFLHANAIAELVELGKQTSAIEWPAFVGYCICTAGTVHVHGAHYNRNGASGEMSVASSSADFLSREMQQLSELRFAWASVQHQRETLQGIYNAHSELVQSLANNPMRYSLVFHLEDFFDRYVNIGGPGGQTFHFDAANLSLSDVVVDFTSDAYTGHDLYAPRADGSHEVERPNLKRKNTAPSGRKRPDLKALTSVSDGIKPPATPGLSTPASRLSFSQHSAITPQPSPALLQTPNSLPPHPDLPEPPRHPSSYGQINEAAANDAAVAAAAAAGFALSPPEPTPNTMPSLSNTPYSPQFTFTPGPSGASGNVINDGANYGPMFGALPTNAFSSPAAWHGDESNNLGVVAASSPGDRSNNGSSGTGPGEEKDPFLSLLEQLAESEHRQAGTGGSSEFDFFFTGTAGSS